MASPSSSSASSICEGMSDSVLKMEAEFSDWISSSSWAMQGKEEGRDRHCQMPGLQVAPGTFLDNQADTRTSGPWGTDPTTSWASQEGPVVRPHDAEGETPGQPPRGGAPGRTGLRQHLEPQHAQRGLEEHQGALVEKQVPEAQQHPDVHHAGEGREEPVQCDQGQLCGHRPKPLCPPWLEPGTASMGQPEVGGIPQVHKLGRKGRVAPKKQQVALPAPRGGATGCRGTSEHKSTTKTPCAAVFRAWPLSGELLSSSQHGQLPGPLPAGSGGLRSAASEPQSQDP